jgi:excisionase family DNA binding protein
MEKTSLIAWRRRDRRFPDTTAQRRARARAQLEASGPHERGVSLLNLVALPSTWEDPERAEAEGLGLTHAGAFLSPDPCSHGIGTTLDESCLNDLRLPLTADQCHALRALPLLADHQERQPSALRVTLEAWQELPGITLRFSRQQEDVPAMIPLQDLCRQLQVGRRAVMRLIRTGTLRCYRVGRRYRFSVADVNHYLARMASQ